MRELMGAAPETLARVCRLLDRLELRYMQLPDSPIGVGIGVSFGESGFEVISVIGPPSDQSVKLTAGIARDVPQDRLQILDLCNRHTQGLSQFPIYLHDAQAGWDVLMQVDFPVQLLEDVPPFFLNVVQSLPPIAAQAREPFVEGGCAGMPYEWTEADTTRLMLRSTM